jgi:hypothetical protein
MRLLRPVFVVGMIGAFITAILAAQASFKFSLSYSTTGGLAIAAMTSLALSLIHDLDATIMILVWNLGMAALIAGLASAFGGPTLHGLPDASCRRYPRNRPGRDSEGPFWDSRS